MKLWQYLLVRTLQIIPTLLVAITIVYFLFRLAPGDPVMGFYGMRPGYDFAYSELDRVRHLLGLDRPLYVQYFDWLWRSLRGDLGYSYVSGSQVAPLVLERLLRSLKLQIAALALSIGIAIAVGVTSAAKQYSKIDYGAQVLTIGWASIPWFWHSLLLILVFSLILGWLPTHGMGRASEGWIGEISHLILPTIVLGTSGAGFLARLLRSSMLEVLRQDYIMTARSKGLKERTIIYTHALRNALLPMVTVIGIELGLLFGGCAIVESIFAYPGIGDLMVQSAALRDYPLLMGISVVVCFAIGFTTLFTDVLYAYLDPRIKFL